MFHSFKVAVLNKKQSVRKILNVFISLLTFEWLQKMLVTLIPPFLKCVQTYLSSNICTLRKVIKKSKHQCLVVSQGPTSVRK